MAMPLLRSVPQQNRLLFLIGVAGFIIALLVGFQFTNTIVTSSAREKTGHYLSELSLSRANYFRLWLEERKGDALSLQQDALLAKAITEYSLEEGKEHAQAAIIKRFEGLLTAYPYRQVSFLSPAGQRLLSVSADPNNSLDENIPLLQRVIIEKSILFSDLYVLSASAKESLAIDILIPVLVPNEDKIVAIIALHVNPDHVIDAIVSVVGGQDTQDEIIIGQQQGQYVAIVDPRRDKSKEVLQIHPLSAPELPAAMAARGQNGLLEGIDYKNQKVLAYTRQLGDSGWFILAKTPLDGLQKSQRELSLLVLVATIICLSVIVLGYTTYRNIRRRQGLELALDDQREQADLLRKLIDSERELHRSQEQLAHSELRFQAVMDSSPIPCALIEKHGRVAYINPAFEQTFGYAHRDVETVLAWHGQAYPDADYSRWVSEEWGKRLHAAATHNATFEAMEVYIRCKDNSQKTVIAEAAYLAGLDGLYVCTLYDITSRKQIEAELSALSAEYAHVIRSLPVGICRYRISADNREGFDYVSDLWCQQLGIDREALQQNPALGLQALYPEDAASFMRIKTAKDRFQWQGRTKKGDRWLEIDATPLLLDNGDTVWSSVQSDITARKQAEQALASERQSLLNILWATGVGTWEWDMHSGALRINERWAEIAGYTRAELEPITIETWNGLVHPEDGAIADKLLKQHFRGETQHYECQVRLRHKDGRWVWILDRGKVITRDKDGVPLTMAGTHLDITIRKEVESALEKQHEELSRSNSELEQFAYAVSHDLRQPLRMVHSYVQLLERRLKEQLNDDTRTMMGFVREGAMRMDAMLVSLLEYSRVGRKGEPLAIMESEVSAQEAIQFLGPAIEEAKATLILPRHWPQVYASRDELTRLFQNLIGNALKYRTEERTPQITLSVELKEKAWLFKIADNGIGINPDQFDRLFKVFQRLQSKDKYEGSGVGLAVCKKIVERHGGQIWVESEGDDKGTTFCFTLPMVDEHAL